MLKVLVVDDDKNVVAVLEHVLSREGYAISVARNGREGLAMAQSEKPDLIILDLMMPEVDGITVSGILFQDPLMKQIPVIILTAQGSARNMMELVPNVRLYVDKPFDPVDIVKSVQRLLAVPPQRA